MAWFNNYYRHLRCGNRREDAWSSACNMRCPKCNVEMTPLKSVDLTVVVEKVSEDASWRVMVSAKNASDRPDYEESIFDTKIEANLFADQERRNYWLD